MSGHISARGTLTAKAGILRSHEHTAGRDYPLEFEEGDMLHIEGEHYHTFTEKKVFVTRIEQEQFVTEWKRDRGI